jgi:hypothetical protein
MTELSHATDLALIPQPFSGFKPITASGSVPGAGVRNPYYNPEALEIGVDAEDMSTTESLAIGTPYASVRAWAKAVSSLGVRVANRFVFEADIFAVVSIIYAMLNNATCVKSNTSGIAPFDLEQLSPKPELVKVSGKISLRNTDFIALRSDEHGLRDTFISAFDTLLNLPRHATDVPLDVFLREHVAGVTTAIAALEQPLLSSDKLGKALKSDLRKQSLALDEM